MYALLVPSTADEGESQSQSRSVKSPGILEMIVPAWGTSPLFQSQAVVLPGVPLRAARRG